MSMEGAVSADLSTGSVFAGRYRVERRIAAGGMGAVYEVLHIETNRRRALKVMHAHYVSSEELRGRFRQEARVAAEIDSEHIVDVFDAGVDESTGMPFLVMELLRGEELGKRLKRLGAFPKEEVVRYLYETSLALDKTHRARIVHRDLKPDNLFLCERENAPPRLKVLDFGIAKIVSDASTQANATSSLGTPLYMAPEQFMLKGGISAATDIFALGMIAFTLLAGKPYWYEESRAGGGMMAFAMHVATGPQESAVKRARELFAVDLPSGFDAWFFRATAREQSARFASAGEAVAALAAVLGVPLFGEGNAPAYRGSMPSMSVVETPAFTPVQSTIVLPGSNNAPGTAASQSGPTQLEMSANGSSTGKQGARSMSLVVIGMLATVVLGLGVWLVVKGFGGDPDEPSASAKQTSPATSAVSSVNQPMVEPLSSAVVVEPAPNAAAGPSSSGRTVVSEAPKPRVVAPATTQPVTPPPATVKTSPTKKGSRGTWEAD